MVVLAVHLGIKINCGCIRILNVGYVSVAIIY